MNRPTKPVDPPNAADPLIAPLITLTLTAADARMLHFLLGVGLPFAGDEGRAVALRLQGDLGRQLRAVENANEGVR